jgi:hypothetical protein
MAPCLVMGQAAGSAAAQSAADGVPFPQLDVGRVQEKLARAGVWPQDDGPQRS